MRHDPASAAVVIMLRSLKMYGMAQAVTDLIEQGAPAFDAAVPILSQLLKAEMAEREVRSIAYHMKAARFPAYKDISGYDFAASEINEATVRQLHRCEFMDGAQNIRRLGMTLTSTSPVRRTIRRHQLREMVPLADSTIYEMEQRGEFPRRFALSPRCIVWDLAEVEAWLLAKRATPIRRAQHPDVKKRKTRPVKERDPAPSEA